MTVTCALKKVEIVPRPSIVQLLSVTMFNPNKALAGKAEAAAKKKALADLKAWSIVLIPADLHDGLIFVNKYFVFFKFLLCTLI